MSRGSGDDLPSLRYRRGSTWSFDDNDSLTGEDNEVDGPPKTQASVEEVEHLVVEHVMSNAAIWIPPPPESDEEEVGSNLVEDDDDDDEGGWGPPSSAGSVRRSSDYAQSKAAMRVFMDGHFRALVAQMLHEHEIPVGEDGGHNSWLEIVSTLALQAANLVKPNTSKGGEMDPGGYVKVKCIASGRCIDSVVVKGVVCHKNVQHRRMTSRFKNPRLLLLGGALEYQRVPNQLSSLDTLLQQEIDHLNATVARIEAHHPNVLLVEKTVAGLAQDSLLAKEVSIVLKVKRSLLERIGRCTGAQVLPSLDNLMGAKIGHCELFHIDKFEEEHDVASLGGRKSSKYLMFFEGCPRPLGCTILLRGASTKELKKVKKVIQSAVFAAYHLALEMSFLADEGATLPYLPSRGVGSSSMRSNSVSSIFSVLGFTIPPQGATDSQSSKDIAVQPIQGVSTQVERVEGGLSQGDMNKGFEMQEQSNLEKFPLSLPDHQSILVLFSSRILWKGTVCELPHLKRIKFYGSSDKPLGKFLKDYLINTGKQCGTCEGQLEMHEYRYTHPQGSLTICLHLMKDIVLAGEKEGKIWMWHRCLRCPQVNGVPPATRRVPMSHSALDLSSGKFLELSFSNHAAASRIAACGHSLRRDCLRFFGMGNALACFQYTPIKMHSVYVPPPQLEFNHPDEQEWLRNEVMEVEELGEMAFAEVSETLQGFGVKIAGVGYKCNNSEIGELEGVLEKEKGEFEVQLHRAAPGKVSRFQPIADVLALNKLRRYLASISSQWDTRLQDLASNLQVQNARTRPDITESSSLTVSQSMRSGGKRTESEVGRVSSPVEVLLVTQTGGEGSDVAESSLEPLSLEKVKYISEPSPDVFGEVSLGAGGATGEHVLVFQAEHRLDALDHTVGEVEVSDATLRVGEDRLVVGSEQFLVNSLALEKQISSPLPFRSTEQDQSGSRPPQIELGTGKVTAAGSSSPAVGELGARRTLSDGHVPILLDLPDTLEASWRGEGGSIDASTVPMTQQADVVATDSVSSCTAVGGEFPVSERAVLEASGSGRERSQSDDVNGGAGDASSQVSIPTSPVKEKEAAYEDLVAPAGGPLASLYRGYSRLSLSQISSVTGNQSKNMMERLVTHPRLRLPIGVDDTFIAVYDDEPTSIIAYALTSADYRITLKDMEPEKAREKSEDKDQNATLLEGSSIRDMSEEKVRSNTPPPESSSTSKVKRETLIDDSLISTTPVTVKVRFTDTGQQGKIEFRVTCYYARQFDALRAKCCGGDLEYIRSMSRCKKWGAMGGRSNVFFAKTLDDRFVVKQVTSTEKYSFLEFAPQYFSHLCESLNTGSPTCLAKILGIYTVLVKQGKVVKELDLLVMENLLYARHVTRLYDLKGSKRSRYNADASGINKVLLDQNLLEAMPTTPIFVSNKAKLLLERAVYNDTSFLAKVNVMDYSLLVGVDEVRQELVVGIIDFIRQYTWDKHLETWVKASGFLGGPKDAPPTVISPKEYKKRFRKAMSNYFVVVPDQWTPPIITTANPNNDVISPDEIQQSGVALKEIKTRK